MIRPLTPADHDLYLALTAAFYHSDAVLAPVPTEYCERTFAELCRSQTYTRALFFETEEQAVGFALLSQTWSQEAGGMVIWIEELFILEGYRGRGLGQEFFRFLEAEYPAARYRLEIEPENEKALRLYERMGFVPLPYDQLVRDFPPIPGTACKNS